MEPQTLHPKMLNCGTAGFFRGYEISEDFATQMQMQHRGSSKRLMKARACRIHLRSDASKGRPFLDLGFQLSLVSCVAKTCQQELTNKATGVDNPLKNPSVG